MKRVFVFLTVLAVAAMLLAGCAQLGAPPSTPDQTIPGLTPEQTSPESSTGTLTVFVTDAPSYTVTSVVVHFSEVWVHKAPEGEDGEGEGEWIQLNITGGMLENGSFDLAELRDEGETAELAAAELVAGKYTQLRVIMDEVEGVQVDYDENPNEEPINAKLPSGTLKFVRPFTVEQDGSTEIVLDFDLQESVVFTGASQSNNVKVIVKPVVKLQVTLPEGDGNEGEMYLYEKDPDGVDDIADNDDDWSVVEDGAWGLLKYNLSGDTFDFEFEGEALEPDTSYALIYYADPWPGDNPGAWITGGTTDGDGKIELEGSCNLDTDLPNPDDENYDNPVNGQDPPGAKIWLVLSADYNDNLAETGPMTAWNPTEYLFERNTVIFDDTDWEPPTP